ncbi:MAG: hypothetical protein R6V76_08785 [Desulfobacterales bacterium]
MIFNLIVFILLAQFSFDVILDYLNSAKRSENLPGELKDIYDEKEYSRSILYEKTNRRFSLVSGAFNLLLILLMLFLGGFAFIHNLSGEFTQNEVWLTVVFFAILMLGSFLPFHTDRE